MSLLVAEASNDGKSPISSACLIAFAAAWYKNVLLTIAHQGWPGLPSAPVAIPVKGPCTEMPGNLFPCEQSPREG